jgi:hypothetical protein
MEDQPRHPLRIVGGSPTPASSGVVIYSPQVCRLLREIQRLNSTERAELSLALRSIEKHGDALRTVAVNYQIQEQIDACGDE